MIMIGRAQFGKHPGEEQLSGPTNSAIAAGLSPWSVIRGPRPRSA
jgi:hypothetical protein